MNSYSSTCDSHDQSKSIIGGEKKKKKKYCSSAKWNGMKLFFVSDPSITPAWLLLCHGSGAVITPSINAEETDCLHAPTSPVLTPQLPVVRPQQVTFSPSVARVLHHRCCGHRGWRLSTDTRSNVILRCRELQSSSVAARDIDRSVTSPCTDVRSEKDQWVCYYYSRILSTSIYKILILDNHISS